MAKPKTDLKQYGITLSKDDFWRYLWRAFEEFYRHPAYPSEIESIDELVLRPDEAQKFCHVIRVRLNSGAPDDVILRALLAHRKKGGTKRGQD